MGVNKVSIRLAFSGQWRRFERARSQGSYAGGTQRDTDSGPPTKSISNGVESPNSREGAPNVRPFETVHRSVQRQQLHGQQTELPTYKQCDEK